MIYINVMLIYGVIEICELWAFLDLGYLLLISLIGRFWHVKCCIVIINVTF